MSLLIHTAVIRRKVNAADGQGGYTETWPIIKSCPGRLSPASGTDLMLAQQLQALVSHAVYLPPFVEVKFGDRIEIDGRFMLVTVPNLRPSVPHHLKVFAVEGQSAVP